MSQVVEGTCVARYDKEHGVRCGVAGKVWESEKDILTLNQIINREEKGFCERCISVRNAKTLAQEYGQTNKGHDAEHEQIQHKIP